MSNNIEIRQLGDDEWPVYSALRLEALRDSPRAFGGSFAEESQYIPEEWKNWLKPYRQAIFALYDGDKPIGLTALMTTRSDPAVGECIASYIKPEYRGQGLSDFLYRARIEWAKNNLAWRKLITGHREGNEASRRANQRHGFAFVQRTLETWPDGIRDTKYTYELDLDGLRRNSLVAYKNQPLENNRN